MPPRFTKLDKMHRVVAKPAGNMMRLKCPAEGNTLSDKKILFILLISCITKLKPNFIYVTANVKLI